MKPFFTTRGLALAATLFGCAPVHAARPMVTDDASILDSGACQIETWSQHASSQSQVWAVPACNVGGSWELGAGIGRANNEGAYTLRAKTIFHPLETNGWGIGLTFSSQFREISSLADGFSVVVPASLSLLDDRVLVHANLGWQRQHGTRAGAGLWAVGGEWNANSRLGVTLEVYGARPGERFAQAGWRLALIPERLVLDAGVGERLGSRGHERYATLGLTLAMPNLR